MPANHYTSRYNRPAAVLPPADSLPYPASLIVGCAECGLRNGCTRPVPGERTDEQHEVMLVGQNPGCFPVGTFVSTPDGVCDISKLVVGSTVFGEKGQTQRVTHIFSRRTDSLVSLKVRGLPEIRLTPNHPVLVVRAKECYDHHTREFCFPCSRPKCAKEQHSTYNPEWVVASELHLGDHVVHPNGIIAPVPSNAASLNNAGILTVPFNQVHEFQRYKFKRWGTRKGFKLGKGLAYVLGWFMAEGCADVNNGTISFCLGAGDGGLRFLLEDQCRKAFGLDCVWRSRGKSRVMSIHSRPLSAWFIELFGGNQRIRRIPACIFHSNQQVIKSFIKGWYSGDGKHKRSGKNDGIVTASPEAAYGLHSLLSRIGVLPTMYKEEWDSPNGNPTNGGYFVSFPLDLKWKVERNHVKLGNLMLSKITSVLVEDADEVVYNVETEDNTYLVPFVVHNSNEDREGRPFIGQSGRYLDSLLFQCGISRESVAIVNLVKCMTPNNRQLRVDEIQTCSHWLDMELESVQPRIIVAMGAPAIARFLGSDAGTVEHLHGKPVNIDGRIILPVYHPAAALRDTARLRQCQEDFQVLRGLVKGKNCSEYHVIDQYPDPVYRVADNQDRLSQMEQEIRQSGEFAVDTEFNAGKLWSVQISAREGTAWFIPIPDGFTGKYDLTKYQEYATAIVHYWFADIPYLEMTENFIDTMNLAYLVGESQGLKELANRLCGIPMRSYNEMVKSGQQKLSIEYLLKASGMEWPDPPTIEETKWDNKKGCLVTKNKKPWHISRKINKMLDDYFANDSTDLRERWRNIPEAERGVVESVVGAMPESSLSDILFDDAVKYASRDADATLRVYHKLQKMITDLELDFVMDMDLGILPMVNSMMQNGMAVDIEHLRKLSEDYDVRMRVMSEEMAGVVGHPFNPNSSDQVAVVVYEELVDKNGNRFKPTKTTPTGKISTDDAELKKTGHPVAKSIIRYRGIQKLKSTYADALIEWARPDIQGIPRVHTTLKTTRVETGRLSSADPNLQNIPTRTKLSKEIKNGFIAPPGKRMGEMDYSQVEMVTLAHQSNCKRLVELFNRGGDPHTEMAAKVFGLPMPKYEEGVTDIASENKYRYPVKRLNFGIAYLIGGHGLSTQLQEYVADLEMEGEPVDIEPWDELTCDKFIEEWYKLNPEVKDFQLERAAEARRYGYVRDPLSGRIRYIPEITCPISSIAEGGARMAANFPITCSAQTIIKTAMCQLWQELPETLWASNARFLMQVHDSLVVEVTDDDFIAFPFFRWMLQVMTGVYKLRVPIKADLKAGYRWGDLKKVRL